MWGVAKIFTSGHSKGGFDRTHRTPPGYGYAYVYCDKTLYRLVIINRPSKISYYSNIYSELHPIYGWIRGTKYGRL